MKKKLLFLFIALVAIMLAIGISASDYTEDDIVEMWNMSYSSRDNVVAFLVYDENKEGCHKLIINGNGRMRDNYFPWSQHKETITQLIVNDGVKDVGRGIRGFRDYPLLSYVKLGDGIERIAGNAFQTCLALHTVEVSENLCIIDPFAFSNCTELKEISGFKYLERIGVEAFQNCKSLISFEADTIKRIERGAFRLCQSLEYVNIREIYFVDNDVFALCYKLKAVTGMEFVEHIGMNAFRDCKELEKLTLGEKIYQLQPNTFIGCTNLREIKILGPISEIPTGAFRICPNLEAVYILGNTDIPLKISNDAFRDCRNLIFFVSQRPISEIKSNAFLNCQKLIGIDLGYNLTRIEMGAFAGCTSLKEVYIPDSIQYVDQRAFLNCRQLTIYAPEHISGISAVKGIVYKCPHIHYEENSCWDEYHNHQFGAHGYGSKKEIGVVPNSELVEILRICECGASTVEYEERHIEHVFVITSIGEDYHYYACECGEFIEEKHEYIDCVCVCGAERFSLEYEDFGYSIHMDHAVYGEGGDDEFIRDMSFVFDKETSNPYDGYRTVREGDKISLMLIEPTMVYGLEMFSGECFGSFRIMAYDVEGNLCVDRILDVDSMCSGYIRFLGGIMLREVNIETQACYGFDGMAIINELDFTLLRDNVKIDNSHDKIEIQIDTSPEINYSGFELDEDLRAFIEDTIASIDKDVSFDMGLGKIQLDVKATNKVTNKKENVTIAIQDVTTDENAELGKRTYDIIVNDKHGNPILPPEESDENGELTLTFKFQAGFKKENINIHYIDDNGKKHKMHVEDYNPMTGEVVFKTKHLSTYEISVDVAEKTAIVNNVIEYLQYSVSETDGRICFGFKLNKDYINSYDSIGESPLEVGIVLAVYDQLKGNQPLDANGDISVIDGCHIVKLNVDKSFMIFDVILTDFTSEYYDDGFVVAAYSKSDIGITYYQSETASNIVFPTVYEPVEEEEQ